MNFEEQIATLQRGMASRSQARHEAPRVWTAFYLDWLIALSRDRRGLRANAPSPPEGANGVHLALHGLFTRRFRQPSFIATGFPTIAGGDRFGVRPTEAQLASSTVVMAFLEDLRSLEPRWCVVRPAWCIAGPSELELAIGGPEAEVRACFWRTIDRFDDSVFTDVREVPQALESLRALETSHRAESLTAIVPYVGPGTAGKFVVAAIELGREDLAIEVAQRFPRLDERYIAVRALLAAGADTEAKKLAQVGGDSRAEIERLALEADAIAAQLLVGARGDFEDVFASLCGRVPKAPQSGFRTRLICAIAVLSTRSGRQLPFNIIAPWIEGTKEGLNVRTHAALTLLRLCEAVIWNAFGLPPPGESIRSDAESSSVR